METLRGEPVRREEVRFRRVRGLWALETMPNGTFRRARAPNPWGVSYWYYRGEPDLWQPLWAEFEAKLKPHERLEPEPLLSENRAQGYLCAHCGLSYVGIKLSHGRRVSICSNHCEVERRRAQQRRWRKRVGFKTDNSARAAIRAAARAGRSCEHCGAAIEAARSTKRFCSDICRVRAHRSLAARQEAAE